VLHCRPMPRSLLLTRSTLFGVLLLIATGCDTPERITRLEKQNQELRAEVDKIRSASDYDLQAKCSRDAKGWFKENWTPDKATILLDFTNHYNKSLNKCFILVEYHYSEGSSGSWVNDMMLWDVYENSKYGNVNVNHFVSSKPGSETEDRIYGCELGKKCKTVEEFNELVRPYMNN
jgi:hypothetical protein